MAWPCPNMSGEPVRKLYITLRRGFAGTKETQRRTLQSLGLRYREQTVVQDNNSTARGAIEKVGAGSEAASALPPLLLNSVQLSRRLQDASGGNLC